MEPRIARVERVLILATLAAGLVLLLAWPDRHLAVTRPMLLTCVGAALLAAGLARDLARLVLGERRVAPAPDPHPDELRTRWGWARSRGGSRGASGARAARPCSCRWAAMCSRWPPSAISPAIWCSCSATSRVTAT